MSPRTRITVNLCHVTRLGYSNEPMSTELLTPQSVEFNHGEVTSGTYIFADRMNDRMTVVETRVGGKEFMYRVTGRLGLIEAPQPAQHQEVDDMTALSERIFDISGMRLHFPS